MAYFQLQDESPHTVAMTNAYAAVSEEHHLPLSLLSLGNNEEIITLQPRRSRVLDLDNLKNDDIAADDDRNDGFSSQQEKDQVRDGTTDQGQSEDEINLSMRGSPTTNPFLSSGVVTPVPFRQSLSSSHHDDLMNSNDGRTVFPMPQTPKVAKKSLARMPPPCRPGEYENDQMDWEDVLPCRALLPDF